jgi:hypothetical protein
MTAPYSSSRFAYEGTETTETSIVRTGGAVDPAGQAQSRKIVTTANTQWLRPFRCEPWAIWNETTGADVTVTVYGLAASASVMNDAVFMDVEYLGDASSALGKIVTTTKADVLATAVAVTSDTSTWDPSSVALRANSTAYAVGNTVRVASNPDRIFMCTVAGTSAATEPAGGGVVTWNPSDRSNANLSNGNLTVTPSTGVDGVARCTGGRGNDKFYFECTYPTITGAVSRVGIATRQIPLTGATSIQGDGSGSVLARADNGNIINFVSTGFSLGAAAAGSVIGIAVDTQNLLAWFRHNGGNWNGVSSADPVTGTNGINIAGLFTNNVVFPVAVPSPSAGSQSVVANFGATAYAFTKPSGFSDLVIVGYNTAVDGSIFIDGTAAFVALSKFKLVATLNSPQPGRPGLIHVRPKIGKPSATVYLDPKVELAVATTGTIKWDAITRANVTLTNGDLTATNSSGTTSTSQGAHVVDAAARATGKYYFEITVGARTGGNNFGFGVAAVGTTYGNTYLTGVVVFTVFGDIWGSGVNSGSSLATINGGIVICIAVDLDNRKIWFRKSTGNYNVAAGPGGDPAANTGGVTIPTGLMVPYVSFGGGSGATGNIATANFGASAFVGTVPSGFTAGWPSYPYAPVPPLVLPVWAQYTPDTLASGGVAQWDDSSGASRHATQATGANQPVVVSAAINGLKAIHLVDATDGLTLPSMAALTSGSCFLVLKGDIESDQGFPLQPSGEANQGHYAFSGTIYSGWMTNSRKTVGDPSQALDQWHILSVHSAVNDYRVYINNVLIYSTDSNTVSFSSTPSIGRHASLGTFGWLGHIAEISLFSTELTAAERDQEYTRLYAKFFSLPPVEGTSRSSRYAYEGTETTETSIVRTGGTAHSRKIVTTANSQWLRPYRAEPFAIWNETTGADVTVTVYGLAAGVALPKNDSVFMDCEYLGDASSTLGKIVSTTKTNVLATNADVPSDSSVWANIPPVVTFDAGRTTPYIDLTNGNLTVTKNTTAQSGSVTSTTFADTGKYYFEYTNTLKSAGTGHSFGIQATTDNSTNTGVVVVPATSSVIYSNGVDTGKALGTAASGNVYGFAYDLNNRLAWIRRAGGNWNGDAAANPATGVGGVAILPGGFTPYVYLSNGGGLESVTANFGATAYVGTPPSGFGNWGADWIAFKLVATLSSPQPGQPGLINVRVKAAKPSATIYIDPTPVLS